ncbi:D-lyxose/D-mannose family sugar isomerase [Poriferisphaera sp. WC338]|uniref:D-lyxose/D-mannose family sugar isomerase n=1 Tax=Poriferisphaera sp. WC338 TaxID=3425129 RepID=UPI003D81BE52
MSKTNTTEHAEVCQLLKQAHITLTPEEYARLEFATFNLSNFRLQGLTLLTYINTDRYCAKEIIMLPHQTCPEHRHPTITLNDNQTVPGKMETFRCRWGKVYLYLEGSNQPNHIQATLPPSSKHHYTVFHEIILNPGEQYTIPPNTLHWFQAGDQGAIISEFSSTSRDEYDIFTDPNIQRIDNSNA